MSRDPGLYLEDIVTACGRILHYTKGMASTDLMSNALVLDAVCRNLQIIGDAAKLVPRNWQTRHPEVEWRRLARLRDAVTHVYFELDEKVLWDAVQNEIPALLQQVRAMLEVQGGPAVP